MLNLDYEGKFLKQLKLCKERDCDINLLNNIVELLRKKISLPPKNKDHKLKGNFIGYRECHIENDWLLIYKKTDTHVILSKTGSHSDLFK